MPASFARSPYYASWPILLGGLFVALLVETTVLVLRRGRGYAPAVIASTFASWGVMELSRYATFGVRFGAFHAVAGFSPVRLSNVVVAATVAYVAVDFVYYARHRLFHSTAWGWALHEPHHSSTELTLLAALRLGWFQRLVDDFFYLPILGLGIDPLLLLVVIEVNHGYQLWCHTDCIGRLPRIDRWLNTPSNHRVHHASTRELADSNLGSTFMIWDRWFGTYRPEPAATIPRYGLPDVDRGLSPLAYQLGPVRDFVASLLRIATPQKSGDARATSSGRASGVDA